MARTFRSFQPDYSHLVDAARNRKPRRVPLYDHGIGIKTLEAVVGRSFWQMMWEGNYADKVEAYRCFCEFGLRCGYDAIPVEFGATYLVQGGRALCGHAPAIIHNMAELEAYPWDELPSRFYSIFDDHYRALGEALPPGMKAVGGVGNGMFELIQDFVPLLELPNLMAEEPESYELLWQKIGDLYVTLWKHVLERFADSFAVCRMGDDLGYRTSTMLSPSDIRTHIIPQYKRIVDVVHSHGKPFLLHSCGCIFSVMDDIIATAKIDAKHSNEDAIAPFKDWFERYNDRIGIFGGIDMDLLCRADEAEIRQRTLEVLRLAEPYRGFAIGCGNSIADYIPLKNYLAMIEAVREYRGDQ